MTAHILFLCTHDSARSVLAESMFNHCARVHGRDVQAHSAGSAPSGSVHPFALEVLKHAGIETCALRSKNWDEFSGAGSPPLAIVITVCDTAAAETCPVFFGGTGGQPVKVHWAYADPSTFEGSEGDQRRAFERSCQALGYRALQLLNLPFETLDRASLQAALAAIGQS